ncbi:MAG: hypothetical protein JXA11_13620 [Phycisphaerae bacterium]|nr:hypothetical protein [Phycisphaerae bacterium]
MATPSTQPAKDDPEAPDAKQLAAVAESLLPSSVIVEYELKYDKGEPPYLTGWLPDADYRSRALGDLVRQERPLGVPGWALSETEVLTPDPMIHPRFVRSIHVRAGKRRVKASPQSYGRDNQYAVILKTKSPLPGVTPLKFDPDAEGPFFSVNTRRSNTVWSTYVKPSPGGVMVRKDAPAVTFTTPFCLLIDAEGKPVGANMNTHLLLGDAWKGDPRKRWTWISAEQGGALLDKIQKHAEKGLLRVTLGFRSPRKKESRFDFEESSVTEKQVIGLLIADRTILVLANLPPKITARLDRIQVHTPDGKTLDATFAHTLKDYGAFTAALSEPREGVVSLSAKELLPLEDHFLPGLELRIQGEKRVAYVQHRRIGQFYPGRRGQIYPRVDGPTGNLFLFDADGTLLALPVARREQVRQEDHSDDGPRLTAARYLQAVLAKPDENVDPSNVPLREEEESRLAWLGVVLQPLNSELARVNKVSDLTRNGQSGALISYVYSDSPASRAGLRAGDILLRLHVEGEPSPVEVEVESPGRSYFPMLWQQYDKIPEQLFDQIPRPWPGAENQFTRMLTDLGFGKKFTAEYVHDGKVREAKFAVTQSPPHYYTAEKYKSDALGMTVRNLTYELRQYFRRPAEQPGVIVSKVEPGSKASVAGLRPYEIITHVNDEPVMNVKDFEKYTSPTGGGQGGGGELRFEVKRWTRGRVAKTTVDAPAKTTTRPTTRPATEPVKNKNTP